jgi:dephospho-CoA kinase
MSMLRIGLTGGIASGKSSVCDILRGKGCQIIDADQVAHELIRRGHSCYGPVIEKFGSGILDSYGEIDRKKLGAIVFEDKTQLEILNSVLHPEVIRTILMNLSELERRNSNPRRIVEASMMIESGFHKSFQRLILVTSAPEQQIERLMSRNGLSLEQARKRIAVQMPLGEKIPFADYIIDNSGTLKKAEEQVNQLFQNLEETVWKTFP